MKLAVFDIDGTLTRGDGLGTRCFFSAFDEVFGARLVDRTLEGYVESTDCGIALEAARRHLAREPHPAELEAFQRRYEERFEREVAGHRGSYRPLPGAERLFSFLEREHGWRVAVATGNWRRPAALKLACAGIEAPKVLAGSEDGPNRAGVLRAAVEAASAGNDGPRVVYVGDRHWDLRAAREVRAGFVGIAGAGRCEVLAREGAVLVDDYRDAPGFAALLEAALPRST